MPEAFRLGGVGMYPTLIFGLFLVGFSLRYCVKPEQRFVPLLVALGLLTLFAGSLGFVAGMIATMNAVSNVPADQRWIALVGLGESLHNLSLALMLTTAATLAVAIGAFRLARASVKP